MWKDTNAHLRGDTNRHYREIRKILRANLPEKASDDLLECPAIVHNAMMVGFCMLLAGLMLVSSCKIAHADCKGLSPELQKAYKQLKNDGFDVSCRKGL